METGERGPGTFADMDATSALNMMQTCKDELLTRAMEVMKSLVEPPKNHASSRSSDMMSARAAET